MNEKKSLLLNWLIPVSLLLLIAPFTPQIDIRISNFFYNTYTHQFSENSFFTFFYRYGLIPGQILGIAALVALLFSYIKPNFQYLRRPALLIGLPIAISAGLITHAILKDHWKRPRPKQVEQYGGTEPFKPFYKPNFFAKGSFKSFPSGHSAMGFCFFSLIFLGMRHRNFFVFIFGLVTALFLGGCLSLARVAQGGHFFSDTIFSAFLMWTTVATCDWFLYSHNSKFCYKK